jgi:DNA repair protein RadC
VPATELIRDLPLRDRPRERLLLGGAAALSDAELLAVLLRVGAAGKSVLVLARELLDELGGLPGLLACSPAELRRRGIGRAKAASVLAGIELGRRLARAELPSRRPLVQAAAVAEYLGLRYSNRDQEIMGALYLDARHRLLAELELFRGTLKEAAVEARLVLKEGLVRGAAAVIVFHTHPSGDPTPSAADLLFTRRLVQACAAVGMELLDHLIVGSSGIWLSLREQEAW